MATNLYELFHRFYQLGLPSVLGADGTALYWALIQKSNELRDPPTFTFTNTEAKDRTGLGHDQAFARARMKLLRAGLVSYRPGTMKQTGIYSQLDRDLDPAAVASRLGRMSTEEGELSTPPTHGPEVSTGDSQPAHTSLTPDSQGTHNPLTPYSQPAHTSLTKQASDVSITREEHNREEQTSRTSIAVEDAGDPVAVRSWAPLIDAAGPVVSGAVAKAMRDCRPLSLDHKALTVHLPGSPADQARLQRNAGVLQQILRERSGLPLDLILLPESRASPGGSESP